MNILLAGFLLALTVVYATTLGGSVTSCSHVVSAAQANPNSLNLWFDGPAQQFTQSLPLGNGRLGAMVFGGANDVCLVLNESSLWSGGQEAADRPDAAQYLPEIRRLLLAGKTLKPRNSSMCISPL